MLKTGFCPASFAHLRIGESENLFASFDGTRRRPLCLVGIAFPRLAVLSEGCLRVGVVGFVYGRRTAGADDNHPVMDIGVGAAVEGVAAVLRAKDAVTAVAAEWQEIKLFAGFMRTVLAQIGKQWRSSSHLSFFLYLIAEIWNVELKCLQFVAGMGE